MLKTEDAKHAHPSFDNPLPIGVGAGAAGTGFEKDVKAVEEGTSIWAQYPAGVVLVEAGSWAMW